MNINSTHIEQCVINKKERMIKWIYEMSSNLTL